MSIAEPQIRDFSAGEEVLIGKGVHFERIRRITGYLVGDMTRWNNAKKAEEHDRVSHIVFGIKPWN